MHLSARKRLAVTLSGGLCVFAASASAQTNVALFGRLDAGIESVRRNPAESGLRLSDGIVGASRFGVRGTEDLGGGLKGVFWLEQGFAVDSGTISATATTSTFGAGNAAAMWARRAYVGIDGGFGSLRLGREYAPAYWTLIQSDQMSFGYYGHVVPITTVPGTDVRFSNGLHYLSPALGGVRVRAAYAFGENLSAGAAPGNQQKSRGDQWGVGVEYASGPVFVGAAHQRTKANAPTGNNAFTHVGTKLTFGVWNVNLGWARNDATGNGNTTTALYGGVGGNFGAHSVGLQYGRTTTDVAAGTDPRGSTIGLRYSYALSKRTSTYATAGRVTNNSTGTVALQGSASPALVPTAGADPRAIALGVAHTF